MGITCCKEVKIHTSSVQRIIADGDKFISWSKGELIGNGSFASVYKAIDNETMTIFAVKCISLINNKQNSQRIMNLVQKEVNILKALDHPNIIKYYQLDFDLENFEINIVTEFVPFGTLKRFINQFKAPLLKSVQKFTKEILSALEYLHKNSIIHRDLKCDNILIDQSSSIKLSDFGLSKVIKNTARTTEFAGSLYWMAPEIFTEESYSFSADIWSLGCTIIEMITGKPPLSNTKSSKEIIKQIVAYENLSWIPECPIELKEFLMECLKKNPKERSSAEELLNHKFITSQFSIEI